MTDLCESFAVVSETVSDSEKLNGRGHAAVSEVPSWWEMQLVCGLFLSL